MVARALAQLDGAPPPAALLRLLRRLAGQGMALLAVLHDLNEAAFVADRVTMLAEGRLLALGPPAAVPRPEALAPVYGAGFRSAPGGGLLPVFEAPP